MTPTNCDFDQKFRKFDTKSDFFPIGKIGNRNFPKLNNFISLEIYLIKFGAKSENLFRAGGR